MMRLLLLFTIVALTGLTGCKAPQTEECVYKECDCQDTLAVPGTKHVYPFGRNYNVTAYEYTGTQNARLLRIDSGNVFDPASIKRVHVLSAEEIVQLEMICRNRKEVCNDYTCVNGNDCLYDPHHCIVFSGLDGKAIAYLETCFTCDDAQTWPEESFGVMCGDFMCDLRTLYQQMGFDGQTLYMDHCPSYKADTTEIWKGSC